jgi:hypothetical protein
MSPDEIREKISRLQAANVRDEEEAWNELRPLGIRVVPYLLEAYPGFRKWSGRVSLVYHSIRYARKSEEAFQLGLEAINDRATLVRHRACSLLAYSLRREAIAYLTPLMSHSDDKTAEDAAAAIDAIENQNHHYFIDREHTSQSYWVVNPSDREDYHNS